jgi:photosystem II stability/assembly factor-like uncharacterized protein
MKIIAFIIGSFILCISALTNAQTKLLAPQEGQSGWYQQESGNTNELFQVQFTSVDTGYIAGSSEDSIGNVTGYLYRTINGGSTWNLFGPPDCGGYLFFLNKQVGWVERHKDHLGIGYYYTEDAGATWTPIGGRTVGRFKFFNKDTGYGVGDFTVARTFDGGKSWGTYDAGKQANLWDLALFDSKSLLAVGDKLPADDNGCASLAYDSLGFIRQIPWCIYSPLQSIGKLNEITALTFGGDTKISRRPTVYKTKDRGFTWEKTDYPLDNGQNLGTSIDFSDDHNGTIVGIGGAIARTTDGGLTWEKQIPPILYDLQSVHFIDSLHGTAVGENGTIIHTTDAGKSWVRQFLPTQVETSVSPEPFAQKTTITYSLPEPSKATIRIYDVTGRELQVLESPGIQEAGKHTIEFDASAYSSGAFYYRLEAEGVYGAGKMTKIVQ